MQHILIVDDIQENRYLLEALLVGHGYGVTSAGNGQEALELARRHAPDLVVADILMPVMDGFALCRAWKADPVLARVPFVFYTATYTDAHDEQLALGLGADLFLTKPREPEILLADLRGVLGRTGTPAAASAASLDEPGFLRQYNGALVRKLEAKLLQLEEANRALAIKDYAIASAVTGLAFFDDDGFITYANGSLAEMVGRDALALVGARLETLLGGEPAVRAMRGALAEHGQWVGELPAARDDDGPRRIQAVAQRVLDRNGVPLGATLWCLDVTENMRLQESLQRAQRLQALSQFAAGVAHDFNNLLTGLFGFMELARAETAPRGPVQTYFDAMFSAFERTRDLTRRLLTFARGGVADRKAVRVPEIVRECCALSLSGSNVALAFSAAPGIRPVLADPNELSQVFNNIVLNARQAMPGGGTLAVAVRAVDDAVEIDFQDEGPGIPAEALPRVFDPFFTTKPEGNGLGLATSYSIVRGHGGSLGVVSKPGAGALFTVRLPAGGTAEPEARPAPGVGLFRGEGRLLVLDDEPDVQRLVSTALATVGYHVAVAGDGARAVADFRAAAAEGRPYDAVLVDLTIRGGTGGAAAAAAMRDVDPDVAIIVTSGYVEDPAVRDPAKHGYAAALAKPFLLHELYATVAAALTRRGG